MFACASVNGDGSCDQWAEIATWSHLSPADAVDLLSAVLVLLATAWGFRLLIRFLLNR